MTDPFTSHVEWTSSVGDVPVLSCFLSARHNSNPTVSIPVLLDPALSVGWDWPRPPTHLDNLTLPTLDTSSLYGCISDLKSCKGSERSFRRLGFSGVGTDPALRN